VPSLYENKSFHGNGLKGKKLLDVLKVINDVSVSVAEKHWASHAKLNRLAGHQKKKDDVYDRLTSSLFLLLFQLSKQINIHIMSQQETPTLKLLLIGNSSVGKSSLLLRFTDDTFLPQDEVSATIGKCHLSNIYTELSTETGRVAVTSISSAWYWRDPNIGKAVYRQHSICCSGQL
jgi:hypothetical protein